MTTSKTRSPSITAFLLVASCFPLGASAQRAATGNAPRDGRPIVAVFDIQTKGASLTKAEIEQLSEILATSLGTQGVYRIVPRAQLRTRLRQQKAATYEDCYDQSCQIAIGRELAAQKSLATTIHRIGSGCIITSTIYDLKSSTSEGGGNRKGPCDIKSIAHALQAIAKDLQEMVTSKLSTPHFAPAVPPEKPRSPPPMRSPSVALSSERLRLTTGDDGEFEVTVVSSAGEVHRCRLSLVSPCVLPRIALGSTRVTIKGEGLYSFNKALTLDKRGQADQWVDVKVKSRPHALSIVGWALGGVALAAGVALGAVGAGIDSQTMLTSGIITGGVGALVVVGSCFLRSTVDGTIGFLNLRWNLLSRERIPRRQWTLAPTLGGASFQMRW